MLRCLLIAILSYLIVGDAFGKQDAKMTPELSPMAKLTVFSMVSKAGTDPLTILRASKVVEEIYSRIVLETIRLGRSEEEPATLLMQRSIDQFHNGKTVVDMFRDGITLSDLAIENGMLSFRLFDHGRKRVTYKCFLTLDEVAFKDKGSLPKCE